MDTVKFGSIEQWQSVNKGDFMPLYVDEGDTRSVIIDIFSIGPVVISLNKRGLPVYSGRGMASLSFSISSADSLVFGGDLLIRTHNENQIVAADPESISFTEVQPLGVEAPHEQVLRLMKFQQDAHERKIAAMLESVQQAPPAPVQLDPPVIESVGGANEAV